MTDSQKEEPKNVMEYETILPQDFEGVFYFTNPSDEEFVGVWGGKEYHFPASSTSPIIIPEHSPLEVQNIRKKFAKNLAEREFFKSRGYETLRGQEGTPGNRTMNSMQQAGSYTIEDLAPYIQQCLKPLPKARAEVKPIETQPLEEKLSRNEEGDLNSEAIDRRTSLRDKALKAGQ